MAGDFRDRSGRAGRAAPRVPGRTRHSRPCPQQATQPTSRRLLLVDRPGAVQADIRYGAFGIDRRDPRWSAITVASYAMGGAFLSRLNAVLREDKGYTYGVRMAFSPLRQGGSFAVQGSFRTEVVADALQITRDLIDIGPSPFTGAGGRRRRRLLHRRLAAALRHRRRGGRPGGQPGTDGSARRLRRPEPGAAAVGDAGVRGRRVHVAGACRTRSAWSWSATPSSWPNRCGPPASTGWRS